MKIYDPTESEEFPGFYEIPGFNRYVINHNGQVINKQKRSYLTGSINPAGYFLYRLTSDDGTTMTHGRHRLLLSVFEPITPESGPLIVNHKNGVKGDDRLENLEWVSPRENVEHAGAMGLTTKCLPISVRDIDTGVITKFPSILACAREFGMSKFAIAHRIQCGEHRVFPERKQYRASHDDSPWYIPENLDGSLMQNGTSKRVLIKDVMTGEIVMFEKLSDLANYLSISPSTVTLWINQKDQPVLPGFVQLKWAHDFTPWRKIDDPYLELSSYTKLRCVQVVDEKTKETRIYASAAECAANAGLTPTALNYRLKSEGTKVFSDGCRYGYYPYDPYASSPTVQ